MVLPTPVSGPQIKKVLDIGALLKFIDEKVNSKEVKLNRLKDMTDEEVVEELTKVRGIGPWTAEMFLMFSLGREDIFSFGDVGLRRGMERLYNLSNPSEETIEAITIKWSPYRTWGSRVLWKAADN